jgi:putative tryptophan/tyrosine transport system substrate-binding protein
MARMKFARFSLFFLLFLISKDIATAQTNVRQIGVLSPFVNRENLFFETLRGELTRLGYGEGKNIAYVYRNSESFDGLSNHAADMTRRRVNVIVTEGALGARAARNATNIIPIVIANVGDAVNQGFAATLARPGGNVTGMSALNAELSAKRLEILKETLPSLSRVAIMREAVGDSAPLNAIEAAAQALTLKLLILQVRDTDEIPSAFSAMTASRVAALELLPGSMFVSRMRQIAELTSHAKLAGIFPDARFAQNGGLMSYGPNVVELYKRSAIFVDKILKGAKAGELPVEQPKAFELAVNLQTAKALGISLPGSIMMRADRVIQKDGAN